MIGSVQIPVFPGRAAKTVPPETYASLVSAIEGLVADARSGLAAALNAIMLQTNWRTGEYIVEYEQHGTDRAGRILVQKYIKSGISLQKYYHNFGFDSRRIPRQDWRAANG